MKEAIEALLGRALQDDESISIQTYRAKDAPVGAGRDVAYRRLLDRTKQTASRAKGVSEAEVDAAIDEAADFVRHKREMRIVADTAVLVRMNVKAAGPARLVLERTPAAVLSTFVLQEVERVLKDAGSVRVDAREQIEQFVSVAQILNPIIREPVVLNDPDDDPVIYTAVDGQADILCTLDRHFYAPGVIEFCRNHGISVMNDIELLRSL